MAREINLVPDVKNEMIKALKLRNFIFFLCIVVASASLAVILVLASIAGGQQAVVNGKKETIDELSKKVNAYAELGDYITIKDQLGNLSAISDNKKVLSRTFNILSAILPTGADRITISELSIDLSEDGSVLSFDAQANAGSEPYIDYNVLDSFKKSMSFMKYDYGNYVDKNGEVIPAYCMVEAGDNGAMFMDPTYGRYAYWLINGEGCNPSVDEENPGTNYVTEEYNGQTVVKVWRTPQFASWYRNTGSDNNSYLTLDGEISGVEHFDSQCIKYTGTENADGTVTWSDAENSCDLVVDGADGFVTSESSNGRDASGELVLRFSASIGIAPEVYEFKNKHMIALAPTGRRNVTDSYVQIQAMFGQRANDCAENDAACKAANGGNN